MSTTRRYYFRYAYTQLALEEIIEDSYSLSILEHRSHPQVVFFHENENFLIASSLFSVYSSLKFWYWRWHGNVAENMTWQESYANFSSFSFFYSLKKSYNEIFYVLCCVCEEQKVFPFYVTSAKGAVAFTHTHIYTNSTTGEKNIYKWKIASLTTTATNKYNNISTDSYGVD